MKKLSIKLRITLWFTTFMVILTVAVITLLTHVSTRVVRNDTINMLIETVEEVASDLNESAVLEDFDENIEGISIAVYDMEDNLLAGRVPDDFEVYENEKKPDDEKKFSNQYEEQHVSEVKADDKRWYVYTVNIIYNESQKLKVTGIVSADNINHSYEVLVQLFIYGLPVFIIVFGIGGYLLIYRAFRPINQIIHAAEQIGDSKDLSQRISLTDGKDEIHALANTFDSMFERLESAFEKEKQFTSDASHELRTPTSVILSQCEFALENASTLEEAKEAIEKIMSQARKMSSLISQLLTLARAEREEKNLDFERINLSELAEIVVENQQDTKDIRNITITHDIEPELYINGDETMLMRLLMNLTDNGMKYGRQNGHLAIGIKRENNKIVLKVTDDGIGISSEDLNRIWDRFYQVDSSRNASNSSMGLGLSMVRWIAKAHKGEVSVESSLGKGTTFTVILPVAQDVK